MTPAARICASIEILDIMLDFWQGEKRMPADKLLDQYFRARRFIGSKDRGAVSEFFYWVIRHKAALDWWCTKLQAPLNGRSYAVAALMLLKEASASQLATLFDGGKYAPSPLSDREWAIAHALAKADIIHPDMPDWVKLNYPQWLEPQLKESLGKRIRDEMRAMQEQAPVDLRANTLMCTREELLEKLKEEGMEAMPTRLAPYGVRLTKREAIFGSPLFKQGYFEMQDEGSQAVAYITDAQPGQRVIDFCAGAGGKTLAVAADMENKGRILAFDTSAKRLAQLPLRLRRAGVFNTEWHVISSESDTYLKRHKNSADRVLVDAPCSGSGTWRRNPDLKWRFNEQDLQEVMAAQKNILESASRLVKTGGRLIYATCSLLACENQQQVEQFLKTRSNFRVVCAQKVWNKNVAADDPGDVSYLWLTPHQDGADGFFAAVLEKIPA